MKKVSQQRTEKAIIDILKDYILWYRMDKGMRLILNAFHPAEYNHEFETDYKYSGYIIAYDLMGVSDEPTNNEVDLGADLHKILSDIIDSDEPANVLAERIYIDWLVEIRQFYTNKNSDNLTLA